jgi:hypothetical protein
VKNTYFSIFTSQEKENIVGFIQKDFPDAETELKQDKFIVFKTSVEPKFFTEIGYLEKTFLLIKQFDKLKGNYFKPMFQWAGRHSFEQITEVNKHFGFKSFRIILKDKEKTISGHRRAIKSLERKIANETRLTINRVNPDTEIWIMHTAGDYGFIIFKLAK